MIKSVAKHLFLRMKWCISLILFFVYYNCAAQPFENIQTFTTQQGLSNNTVISLAKDEDGFLWVGTNEGLNQYDGTEFITILSNAKNNLPSNIILKICCIDKTTLLISTQAGICFLDTKTKEGKLIHRPGAATPNEPWKALDILYDKGQQEIWVAASDGIYVLTKKGEVKRKLNAAKNSSFFAFNLFKDKIGKVFFYSRQLNGFFYPDFSSGKLIPIETTLSNFPLNSICKQYELRNATFENDKVICCFTSNDEINKKNLLAYYDNASGRTLIDSFSIPGYSQYFANNAFQLNDSVLLMNAYFGEPHLYNLNTKKIQRAADHPLWFTSWPDGINAKLLVEKENLWVATAKGLLQIPRYEQVFKTNQQIVNRIAANTALVSFNYGMWYNSRFWLSCLGAGIFAFDTAKNTIQGAFDKPVAPNMVKKVISDKIVKAGNALWFFSVYGPATIDETQMKPVEINASNKIQQFDESANFPLKDHKGNIWISIPNGVAKYDVASNSFSNFMNNAAGGNFPLQRGLYKTEDGAGNIWFARQDTLVKYDPATQKYAITFLKKDGLPVKPVQALVSDGGDLLYLHVNGAFGIYTISTGQIELFTKQIGIVSTFITEIVTDNNGNPWIATESGLIYYDKKSKHFYSYTKADGLPDNKIISLNFTDDTKKELFLGFPSTYCTFDAERLLQKKNAAIRNTITGVEVNGTAISFDEKKIFSYTNNSISFFYTGINFTLGSENSYAYMLEGLDKEWQYSGKKRQCSYINLPPGDYTFKIKSANQQGEWNETPATFSFTIAAPFWQTLWFRITMAVIATLLIYWFIKRRDNIKAKENKVALQMSELKLTALQSQMNPHFIFNSLNSIQNYILKQDREAAARYLTKFSRLMRRILDHSFNNLTPLHEIIETLKMYMELEAFRFNNEFSWEVKVDNDESINDVKLPPLLLQPYVENAIIHGLMQKEGDKKLLINIFKKNNELHCVIDDNGVGRGNKLADTKGHISRGQKLTADMLATMKQLLHTNAQIKITDKKDEQNNPAGTTVDLIIPLTS